MIHTNKGVSMNNVNTGQNFRPRRNNNNYKKNNNGGGRQDFRRGSNNNGGNNHSFNTGQNSGGHGARHPELDIVIDARAAKRASMMRDKYQSMARDAQTGGDRVYGEYCLQHVEHYNRVLNAFNESRPVHLRENTNENNDEMSGENNNTPAEQTPKTTGAAAPTATEEPYQAAAGN